MCGPGKFWASNCEASDWACTIGIMKESIRNYLSFAYSQNQAKCSLLLCAQTWKNKHDAAKGNPLKTQEAADMCVLYESLQLAHKCILNRCVRCLLLRVCVYDCCECTVKDSAAGPKVYFEQVVVCRLCL
jgi:hypothetical protein